MIIVITFGKLLIWILRKSGRNGSALPGLIAEKFYPSLLTKQLDKLDNGVIVVTGTNGKTTTTKSIVYLLEQCGYKVFTNPSGSNFTRGVYASIINYSSISSSLDYDIAVLELDEAYSRVFAKLYSPRLVVALNVMRDQLDRYGEIDKTAEMIGDTISYASEGAILNYDDHRVSALKAKTTKQVSYFGIDESLKSHIPSDDDLHGKASNHHKKKHYKKSNNIVILSDYKPGYIGFNIAGKLYRTKVQIAGIHNAFNLAAAVATVLRVCPDMEPQFVVPTIKNIPAAFGRGEVINIEDKSITLALVKNPSGFRQSLRSYDTKQYGAVAFVINDEFADGRDVSWLWDVDFTSVSKDTQRYTSGIRGSDMALRLKYDELKSTNVADIPQLVSRLLDNKSDHILIFCTYTAMLQIRSLFGKKTKLEDIW